MEVSLAGFPTEAVGLWIILVWFAFETWWDMRRSTMLPIWLVLPPVALGILSQAVYGNWFIVAAVIIAVVLHNAPTILVRALGTVILLGGCLLSGNVVLAVGFVLYWILWEAHVMGGADALAAYAALMIAPNANMFWSLLAGIFLWALAAMVIVYRTKIFARVKLMVWRVLMRNLPQESEIEAEGKPTLGGLFLGVAFYMIWAAQAAH
jgi:hypothetical protein